MNNEYKDYMYDKAQSVVLDACVMEKVTKVRACQLYDAFIIEGLKNNEKVKFEVWFDDKESEWKFERREL